MGMAQHVLTHSEIQKEDTVPTLHIRKRNNQEETLGPRSHRNPGAKALSIAG